jgi:hypothetical protein
MINKNKNQKTYKRARYLAPQHGPLTQLYLMIVFTKIKFYLINQ